MEQMPVSEEAIPLDRLVAADEVFLSGSVRGIEPVRDCEGAGSWPEGRVTTLVADALRRLWEMDR
jgi:branched-subunit amino acid aminotransferase/4-amino-4-deoxychorismate lyase